MAALSRTQLEAQVPGIRHLSALDSGGQKDVYVGDHERFGKTVLKVVRGAGLDRALREVEAVQALSSSHVPTVFEVGTLTTPEGPVLYLVEQYVPGQTLRHILNDRGRLGVAECLNLLGALLEAAAAMEQARIVHRDIKPENIMCGEDGAVWLLDFGIARVLDLTSITDSHARFGPHTAGYAAPEQFRNRKREIDIRADLFSIGVVVYEALSGDNPFRVGAESPLEVLTRTETMPLEPLRMPADTQGELSGLLAVMCDRYPSRRPPSAQTALAWYLAARRTISLGPE